MRTILLGIESSCDDTSASICRDGEVISNVVANQLVHQNYGGVVPELASRAHLQHIVPVVDEAVRKAGIEISELDGVAFTRGPGLVGSLIVGVSFAKALALTLDIPLVEVHHMHAHLMSNFIDQPKPPFPFLCMTVSGGHTEIALVESPLRYRILGRTLDDAAGEAFDKSGKLLGLPYPAGPIIDKLAADGSARFEFPTPRVPKLDFSFSGIKTAFRYFLRDKLKEDPEFISKHLNDICASIQHRIVSYLLEKLVRAADQTGIRDIAIAGGVSANRGLRSELHEMSGEMGWDTYFPALRYCTDNAAMIALTGYYKFRKGEFSPQTVSADPRYKVDL